MKIDVGDYVRTRWGCIAKFEGIHEGFYEFDNIIMDESRAVREKLFVDIVERSSPNIIDLIELGDYVNGKKVCCFRKENCDYDIGFQYNDDFGEWYGIDADEIESIVTKEQIKAMEYKIER